jgi:hypothetical protein
MFFACHQRGSVPAAWKVARLSPIFKKGDASSCESYRMIAVNSVLYRLYAGVQRDLLTSWAVRAGAISESQFGFVPGRDTMQPTFILRHLVAEAKHAANSGGPRGCSRLFVAFLDFSQAYDRVDRRALWAHLEQIGTPPGLIQSIQGLYAGDAYTLVDGQRRTPLIHPTLGVKQGCPLSPLLFALFVNDFESRVAACAVHGAPLRGSNRRVSHLFYADDLALISRSWQGLQALLDGTCQFSRGKGMLVNVQKSKIVVFNTRVLPVRRSPGGPVARWLYQGQELEVVGAFKYLGLELHSELNMVLTQEPWARAMFGAIQKVHGIARDMGVRKSIWAMARLYQTYACGVGLYGCQIWGSRFAHMSRVFESGVARRQLCMLKNLVGAKRYTANWPVLHELGATPCHTYFVKALLKFQKKLITANSPLLTEVMRADADLARSGGMGCWTAEFALALKSIGDAAGSPEVGARLHSAALEGRQVEDGVEVRPGAVLALLRSAHLSQAWSGLDGIRDIRVPDLPQRKLLTYFAWFRIPDQAALPAYLRGLPSHHHEMKQLARFRLGSHSLGVETGRYNRVPWQDRRCARCPAEFLDQLSCAVDDEEHAIFDCVGFQEQRLGTPGVVSLLTQCPRDVRAFMAADGATVRRYISGIMDKLDQLAAEERLPG